MAEPISKLATAEPAIAEEPMARRNLNGTALRPAHSQLPGYVAELVRKHPRLPGQDELPSDDDIPMETPRHRMQMELLIETLGVHWADRQDFYAGGNMFVYFSPDQVKTEDFRGPDFYVALGVSNHERKSWVVWEEGKAPDVIIELLSETTAEFDRTQKKAIYQTKLEVPEYYWFDPFSGELMGFKLTRKTYRRIAPDAQGRLISPAVGLALTRWEGKYQRVSATWLRWETLDGKLVPTEAELVTQERNRVKQERKRTRQERVLTVQERARAEHERARAEHERARAEHEHARAEQEQNRAERLAARLRELGIDPDELN